MDVTLVVTDDSMVRELVATPGGSVEFVRSLIDAVPPIPVGRDLWVNPPKPVDTMVFSAPAGVADHIVSIAPGLCRVHEYRLLWGGGCLRFVADDSAAGAAEAFIALGAFESEVIDWRAICRTTQRQIRRGRSMAQLPERPSVVRPLSIWQVEMGVSWFTTADSIEETAAQISAELRHRTAFHCRFGGLRRRFTFSREAIVAMVFALELLRPPSDGAQRWTEPT